MVASFARVPLLAALLGLAIAIAIAVRPAPLADEPRHPHHAIHFVHGTAAIMPGDLAYLASLDARDGRVIIVCEQFELEPADLAQRRVDAIASIVRDHGETGRVVVVTTSIDIADEPPPVPTDDATIELR